MERVPRILYSVRKDGLGARLKALAWVWRLARRADARAVIAWPPTDPALRPRLGLTMPLGEIFDLQELAFSRDIGLRLVPDRMRMEPHWPTLCSGDRRGVQVIDPATVFVDSPVLVHRGLQTLLLPGETMAEGVREVGTLLRSLPLAPALLAALDATRPETPYVAAHYRGGDLLVGIIAAARKLGTGSEDLGALDSALNFYAMKCMPLADFLACVEEEIGRGRRVYTAVDDADVLADVRARYGDALVEGADEGLTPLQAAMLDLVMQSRAQQIRAAPSGFALAASLYGTTPIIPAPIPAGFAAFAADLRRVLGGAGVDEAATAFVIARLAANDHMQRRLARTRRG